MLHFVKQTRLAKWLKETKLYKFIPESQGDWRYPFMCIAWWMVNILVPRRKVSVDGVTFTLSCTNWVTHFRWFLFKSKEQEVRYYINNYVKEKDVFFDVGANVGVFSVYSAKCYSNISVYCFEPEYSNLCMLKENIVYNGLLAKTKIYSIAISNFVGFSNLYLQDFTAGSAAHTESKESINVTDEGYPVVGTEGIMAVTLDYICEQLGIVPNAMKIDTDGNEDKVLDGSVKTLSDKRLRSLVIEMPDDAKHQHCRKILTSTGFNLTWSDRKKTRNEIWTRRGKYE